MQSTARDSGRIPCSDPAPAPCTRALSPVSGHAAEKSRAQRDPLAQRLGGGSGFRLDFDIFLRVVENSDSDVVEAEVLLNVGDDFRHHLFGILAGDRRLRDAIQKCQLMRTALLLGKEARVFHRYGNLAGRGLHNFQIALFENVLPFCVPRRHYAGRAPPSRIGAAQKHLAGFGGTKVTPQPLPATFSRSARISSGWPVRRCIPSVRSSPCGSAWGEPRPFPLPVRNEFFAFLESDIKIAGVENLAQFFLNRAQISPGRAAN